MELWRKIPGYSNYSASDQGRIRNSHSRILKPSVMKTGYVKISLVDDSGKRNTCLLHRLVCFAFYGVKFGRRVTVDHRDENKQNNKIRNLEWVPHGVNIKRSWQGSRKGSYAGDSNPNSNARRQV